jgi:hypothetical protein
MLNRGSAAVLLSSIFAAPAMRVPRRPLRVFIVDFLFSLLYSLAGSVMGESRCQKHHTACQRKQRANSILCVAGKSGNCWQLSSKGVAQSIALPRVRVVAKHGRSLMCVSCADPGIRARCVHGGAACCGQRHSGNSGRGRLHGASRLLCSFPFDCSRQDTPMKSRPVIWMK